MTKRILLTGGNGYIGLHLANFFAQEGYEITIIDDLSNSFANSNLNKFQFYHGKISDKNLLEKVFQKKYYAIFHLASFIEVGESVIKPSIYYENNIANTIIFLNEVIKYSKDPHFIFSSSAAVYKSLERKITEDDAAIPESVYGKTKLIMEDILSDYAKSYNLSYGIFRYFNICGADYKNHLGENRKSETHIIPLLLRCLNRGDIDFFIYGNDYKTYDGTCIRDYVHVLDLCQAHSLILDYLNNSKIVERCFNIGSSTGFSVLEIVKKAQEISRKKFDIKFKEKRKGDADSLVSSNQLAKNILGWNPKFSDLENIIESAWQWEKMAFRRL